MSSKIGRGVTLLLAIVLIIALFAGCSKNQSSGTTQSGTSQSSTDTSKSANQQSASSGPEPLKFPIVTEPITLKYFWQMDAKAATSMKSYAEIACFQEMEKKSGIKIDWIHPPSGQETEQFNLMLASQDLPDMIYWSWRTVAGGPAKAISDGSIAKLNDLIDKYAPNFKKIMDENPEWRKQAVLDDGTFYMFPFIREDKSLRLSSSFQMRKDWLDKLGLKVPTTIDEWYTVLKAFKTQDPNGNGEADEIPFVSIGATRLRYFEYAYGIIHDFYQENGKVKYGPAEPAFKDYLTTMRQWYKEGLIDPDFAATDTKNFEAKITGNKGGSYYGMLSGNMGKFLDLMHSKDPSFDLVGVPWPKGPAGKSYGPFEPPVTEKGTAISAKSKYQKEATKWLDYWYSDEGHMLINFGIEGESYTMSNGQPVYTDKVLHNPDGLAVSDALIRYAMSVSSGSFVQDKRYFPQMLVYPEQKDALNTWVNSSDPSLLLPPITPTTEESQRMAAIMGEVNTYVDEMFNKFIMGQEPLENFDNYVKTLKNMGIDEAVSIEQAALDRYNARK